MDIDIIPAAQAKLYLFRLLIALIIFFKHMEKLFALGRLDEKVQGLHIIALINIFLMRRNQNQAGLRIVPAKFRRQAETGSVRFVRSLRIAPVRESRRRVRRPCGPACSLQSGSRPAPRPFPARSGIRKRGLTREINVKENQVKRPCRDQRPAHLSRTLKDFNHIRLNAELLQAAFDRLLQVIQPISLIIHYSNFVHVFSFPARKPFSVSSLGRNPSRRRSLSRTSRRARSLRGGNIIRRFAEAARPGGRPRDKDRDRKVLIQGHIHAPAVLLGNVSHNT